jgi:hypothetical protein
MLSQTPFLSCCILFGLNTLPPGPYSFEDDRNKKGKNEKRQGKKNFQ